jgi:GNAT superfamily N-acetyltransferase
MADLIVKLYDLRAGEIAPAPGSYTIRRAFAAESRLIVRWVAADFGDGWASECEASFARSPVACYIAVDQLEHLVGFSCYDATARGVYGPVGVARANRKQGIGRALLLATLRDMWAQGYAYAAIGGAGAAQIDFYKQTVGAIEVPDSTPGFYRGMLRVR